MVCYSGRFFKGAFAGSRVDCELHDFMSEELLAAEILIIRFLDPVRAKLFIR